MSRKAHFKLPGISWNGEVSSVGEAFLVFVFIFLIWLAFASLFSWITFIVLNWAIGIFGYHVTGLQFIAGLVLLGIARSAISYLLNRE
jgi:hypothetical protein